MEPSGRWHQEQQMLVSIDTRRPRAEKDDAISLLVACHGRTRAFCATALRLSRAKDAPASDVADVATAVLRHFTIALPLHIQDEDESVAARLHPVATPSVLKDLKVLDRQHRLIGWLVDELVPQWKILAHEPGQLKRLARRLGRDTTHLRDLFRVHLLLEEQHVYPAVRYLTSPGDRISLSQEIRDRRARALAAA